VTGGAKETLARFSRLCLVWPPTVGMRMWKTNLCQGRDGHRCDAMAAPGGVVVWLLVLTVPVMISFVAWAHGGAYADPSGASSASHSADAGTGDGPNDVGGLVPVSENRSATADASVLPTTTDGANRDSATSGVASGQPGPLNAAGPSAAGATGPGAGTLAASSSAAPEAQKIRWLGVNADLGVSGVLPDTGLLLALRPVRWAHGQIGIGYNTIALGFRGGVTLVSPIVFPLSLTLEGGHYYEGDANRVVHWFNSGTRDISSLRHFSYDYMNLLAGLALQSRHLTFYIRGGVTWMRTTINNFAESVNDVTQVGLQADDPKLSYRGPSAKLGLIVFP